MIGKKSSAGVTFSSTHENVNFHSYCVGDGSGTPSSLHTQLELFTFNYIFPAH